MVKRVKRLFHDKYKVLSFNNGNQNQHSTNVPMTEDNKTVKDISLDIPRSLDSHLYDTMMYINIQN